MKEILPVLQRGAQFTMSSCEYEVVHVGKDQLRITPLQGGPTRLLGFDTLSEWVGDGRVTFGYTPPTGSSPLEQGLMSGLSEPQLEVLKRKLHYVHGIYRALENPCSQLKIREQLPSLAKALNDQDPPCASTVASWIKRWIDGGRTDAALIPKAKPSRFRSGLDREVDRILMESIQQVYMTRQRHSIKTVVADVELRISQYNKTNKEFRLQVPSGETVRRYIKKIDAYVRDRARHGVHYAQRRHRTIGRAFQTTEVLEVAMADGQIMDLILVDAEGQDIGRAFLTVILDVYSRCVLAAYVSLAPFSGATLLKAMSEAVVKKGDEPAGIPSKLIVDNGSDYRHAGFVRFCSRLNIVVEPCPPRTPNAKSFVERFFRTLNEQLIHKFPGTTFSNPTDRGDYASQKLARMRIDEIRKHITVWIQEFYHQDIHRGLGRAPIDVWTEGVQA